MYDNACIGNFSLIFFPKFFIAEEKKDGCQKSNRFMHLWQVQGYQKRQIAIKKVKKAAKKNKLQTLE